MNLSQWSVSGQAQKGENMKLGKAINYKIIIEPSDNEGFIAKVGCGKFVFTDKGALISAMGEFLEHPEKWEGTYNKLLGNEAADEPCTAA